MGLPWAQSVTVYPATELHSGYSILGQGSAEIWLPMLFGAVLALSPRMTAFVLLTFGAPIIGIGAVITGFSRIHGALYTVKPGIYVTLLLSQLSFFLTISYFMKLKNAGLLLSNSEARASNVKQLAKSFATEMTAASVDSQTKLQSAADELAKFAELKEKGLISAEEFKKQKSRLLGS
jgi:ribosomal protein S20